MERRHLLTAGVLAGAVLAAGGAERVMGQNTDALDGAKKPVTDRGPRIDAERVKAFVGAGHGDPAKVEAMLKEEPRLVNAAWDWGGGDYETALGGAAHMGRHDIARLLLERGARLDLFAAAMLGELEIVRAALTAFPGAIDVPGPHGIPLIDHARRGGKAAEAVLRFLESRGPARPNG